MDMPFLRLNHSLTFQSGNIIMLGYEFAKHGLTAVMPYIISIISFGAGAMLLAWNPLSL
ncbi:DUF1275 family protein [Providencia rettgeri]